MRTRRGFLAFLAASTGTLAGCAANSTPQSASDDALSARAAASARTLAALYEAAVGRGTVDRPTAESFRGHHLAHVQRLTNGSGSPAPATTEDAAAANAAPTRADLATAERTASGTSAEDVNAASPDLAALLASIAACRALHAQALDPSTASADAPPLSTAKPSSGEPLQPILAAEHAVIFAYGALGPHLTGSQLAAAHAAFDVHRGLRDALMNAIGARGGSPQAAEASYDLPFRVTDAASACRLAALVEARLAAVCARAVYASSGGDRTYAAWALTQASLRAQTWGAPVTAFPGLDT